MRIGLIDADSHNFPNLVLMKLSAYHKSRNHHVEFVTHWDDYDRVYISKVFSFSNNPLNDHVINCNDENIFIGGTGWNDIDIGNTNYSKELNYDIEHIYPDYSLYNIKNQAIGFLTRGCSRNCPFCIVNGKEGSCHKVADLHEFYSGQKTITLLDPNILEYNQHLDLLIQLCNSKSYIEFSQGLDIRLINGDSTNLLKKMKLKRIHFAYDEIKYQHIIETNLTTFKKMTGFKRNSVSVYILCNFNTSIEEDLHRILFCKSLDFTPYVMLFNKDLLPNGSIHKHMQRWCNSPMIFNSCSFDEYLAKTKYRENNNYER